MVTVDYCVFICVLIVFLFVDVVNIISFWDKFWPWGVLTVAIPALCTIALCVALVSECIGCCLPKDVDSDVIIPSLVINSSDSENLITGSEGDFTGGSSN